MRPDQKPGSEPLPRSRMAPAEVGRLLSPRSIAVIGASADPAKFASRFVRLLQKNGYGGRIYPVNARREEVFGVRCYPELTAIPDPVDCVVHSISASDIGRTLADCEKLGVKLLVIASTGFAERGDEAGRALQDQVEDFARRTGIRVIGPNCVGFVNFRDDVMLAAAAALDWPDIRKGSIGVASQSGGMAVASLIFSGLESGFGFSHIVSTGNEADLDVVDFARFFVVDPDTHVIALTIEGIRDGAGFRRMLGEAAAQRKPVVVLKAGRSALGKAMAASHTGAMTGSDEVFNAICAAHGVTRVDDVDELYEFAAMFAKLRASGKLTSAGPRPAGGCTAYSISGGHTGHFADIGAFRGLAFPEFSEATQGRLRTELKTEAHFANPLDMSTGSVGERSIWGRCLDVLLRDPSVKAAVPLMTAAHNFDDASNDIIRVADGHPDKAVIVAWLGGAVEGQGKAVLQPSPVPVFTSSTRVVKAITAWDRYCRAWHSSADASPRQRPAGKATALVNGMAGSGRRIVGERGGKEILSALGFPVAVERLAASPDEAVAAAQAIGYPVAMKGDHPDILHKSEAGIVKLGLRSQDEAAEAYRDIAERMAAYAPGRRPNGILVQEMVPPGIEIMMGVKRDETFGPAVAFGLGGVFVEVLKDISIRVAPFSLQEARAMMEEVRSIALLKGARGRHPADLDRIARLLVGLGDFALENARLVSEIDINPVILIDRPDDNLRVVDALMVLDGPEPLDAAPAPAGYVAAK